MSGGFTCTLSVIEDEKKIIIIKAIRHALHQFEELLIKSEQNFLSNTSFLKENAEIWFY